MTVLLSVDSRCPKCVAKYAFLSLLLASSACNSSDNVESYSQPPACNPPNGTQVSLVYPAPDSVNVPPNFPGVVIASSAVKGLPDGYRAVIVQPMSIPIAIDYLPVQPAPSAIPSPFATPIFTPYTLQESASPGTTWPAGVPLSVYLDLQGESCAPQYLLGAFSTQATPAPVPSSSPSPTHMPISATNSQADVAIGR
jgi:hypothetical protein